MSHLGRRVEGDLKPGMGGTVINENASSGRWPRTDETYDILWDDGSVSRRVAKAILEENWRFLPEATRSRVECQNRWYDYLMALCKQRGERGALQRCTAAAPSTLPSEPSTAGASARISDQPIASAVSSARAVRQAVKGLLEERYPGVQFGVHCERRVLSAAWMDGPLPGAVWKALSGMVDQKAVGTVRVDRALSEVLVQAAVDYALWQCCPDAGDRDRLALRVNAQAYLDEGLEQVRANGGPASGVPFQSLVRCVLERWDDCAGVFRQTRRTQALKSEVAALFPHGDAQAASQFRVCRGAAAGAMQRTRDTLSQFASPRAERERS
ncbi:hypothetical protein [Ramlibacter sp. AN1133]|uniref:hypothetical protein n=1 Tax=Ramlibacter sp. AN1133 TaxID=3133429 RepID=UPI0030C16FBF